MITDQSTIFKGRINNCKFYRLILAQLIDRSIDYYKMALNYHKEYFSLGDHREHTKFSWEKRLRIFNHRCIRLSV